MQEIQSLKNPKIAALLALTIKKNRDASRTFLVEGHKMVGEALALGLVVTLVVEQGQAQRYFSLAPEQVTLLSVPDFILERLCESKTPQGVIAEVTHPSPRRDPKMRLLALDRIQDPGNLGTLLRTAEAAGWDGLLLGEGCADPFGAKALRASMGSIFRVPLEKDLALSSTLKDSLRQGYALCAAELGGEDLYHAASLPEKVILMIGSEGQGLSPELTALATHRYRLPMAGAVESLNAAMAAGLMMYEWTRREKE